MKDSLVARIGSHILLALVTFVLVVTFLFILFHLAPGDPVTYRFRTGGASLSEEQYNELRRQLGLHLPIIEQYINYLSEVVRGDLGRSFTYKVPVLGLIASRVPATLILMVPSMVIGATVGTFLGAVSARKPNSATDNIIRVVSLGGYSIPQFWLGILLLQIFVLRLGLFPSTGMSDPTIESGTLSYYQSVAWHAILPIFALSLFYIALFARYSRTSFLDQASENYVLTARAKGLTSRQAFHRHVVRNGLLPVVTLTGLAFRYLFGGAVLIETVFSWPGIGLMLFNSVLARDFPVLLGVFVFAVVSVIIFNIIVDVIYGYLDPRVRSTR